MFKKKKQKKLKEKLIVQLYYADEEYRKNVVLLTDYRGYLEEAKENNDRYGIMVHQEHIERFEIIVDELNIKRKFLRNEIERL